MRTRRTLAAILAGAALLAGAACGREGAPAPGGQSAPVPQAPVAQGVTVAGSPTFDRIVARGRLVLGTKDNQPGLAERSATTGQYSGFDVEIGKRVAAGLGFGPDRIEFRAIPSAAREDAIIRGDVDYYIGTYTISDARKQRISFAGPYFVAGQSLLVRGDETAITGPETLRGRKVCTVTGSTPLQNLQKLNLVEPANIVQFQGYADCVSQLLARQVDAVTTDDAILRGFAAQDPGAMKVVGPTFSSEPYGIGLPKDDQALRAKVNSLLQASFDDGSWRQTYDATLGKAGGVASPPALQP